MRSSISATSLRIIERPLKRVITMPIIDKLGLQYFFTVSIVLLSCPIPCRLYMSACAGIIAHVQAVRAFIVSIPRAGGGSTIM